MLEVDSHCIRPCFETVRNFGELEELVDDVEVDRARARCDWIEGPLASVLALGIPSDFYGW